MVSLFLFGLSARAPCRLKTLLTSKYSQPYSSTGPNYFLARRPHLFCQTMFLSFDLSFDVLFLYFDVSCLLIYLFQVQVLWGHSNTEVAYFVLPEIKYVKQNLQRKTQQWNITHPKKIWNMYGEFCTARTPRTD